MPGKKTNKQKKGDTFVRGKAQLIPTPSASQTDSDAAYLISAPSNAVILMHKWVVHFLYWSQWVKTLPSQNGDGRERGRAQGAHFASIREVFSGVERKQWAGGIILFFIASNCVGGRVLDEHPEVCAEGWGWGAAQETSAAWVQGISSILDAIILKLWIKRTSERTSFLEL